LTNNSFDVPAVDQHEREREPSGQALISADSETGGAHHSDQSKPLHSDWRELSGIALPTIEDLHYAHHFLIRAAERRLKEVVPAGAPPPCKPSKPQST